MTVHFIGAGPGAADLLTLRAVRLLASSPVCVYAGTYLDAEVLDHCAPGTRLVDSQSLDLDAIVAAHRATAARDDRSLASLLSEASDRPPTRGFAAALRGGARLSVIAEIKRRSPSKGDLFPNLDPAELARTYEAAGASCLSVLTDVDHFGGSVADLEAARAASTLPVLRKDFTVDARDVADARLMGADAVLLIVAALTDAELTSLIERARSIGLTPLVEAHTADEVRRAVDAGANVIGVNARNLQTLEVDSTTFARLAPLIPSRFVKVAESGLERAHTLAGLRQAGYQGFLIGETFMKTPDPAAALARLVGELSAYPVPLAN